MLRVHLLETNGTRLADGQGFRVQNPQPLAGLLDVAVLLQGSLEEKLLLVIQGGLDLEIYAGGLTELLQHPTGLSEVIHRQNCAANVYPTMRMLFVPSAQDF
mmetsp:Transcript_44305/g.96438  ORF Transcript_44305/g.96438 Transcript_44305/m.96438 type:complete len:102 (-) Transcript_44305:178-483(-)